MCQTWTNTAVVRVRMDRHLSRLTGCSVTIQQQSVKEEERKGVFPYDG